MPTAVLNTWETLLENFAEQVGERGVFVILYRLHDPLGSFFLRADK
jgi:hypothetical protein